MTARRTQGKSAPAAKAAGADSSANKELTVETDHKTTIVAGPEGDTNVDDNAVADGEGVELNNTTPAPVPTPEEGSNVYPAGELVPDQSVASNHVEDQEASKAAALALLAQGEPVPATLPTYSAVAAPQPNGTEVKWGNGRTRAIVTGTMVTASGENGAQYQGFQGDTIIASAEVIDKLERLGAVYRLADLEQED